jgi:hypothetical protein
MNSSQFVVPLLQQKNAIMNLLYIRGYWNPHHIRSHLENDFQSKQLVFLVNVLQSIYDAC